MAEEATTLNCPPMEERRRPPNKTHNATNHHEQSTRAKRLLGLPPQEKPVGSITPSPELEKKQVERPEKRRSATPKTHRCAQIIEERRCLKKHGDAPPIYQIWKMVPSIGAAQPLQSSHQSHCLKRRETRRTSFAPCVTTRRIPPTRDEEQARFEHHRSFKGEAEEIRERKGEEGEALSGHR